MLLAVTKIPFHFDTNNGAKQKTFISLFLKSRRYEIGTLVVEKISLAVIPLSFSINKMKVMNKK